MGESDRMQAGGEGVEKVIECRPLHQFVLDIASQSSFDTSCPKCLKKYPHLELHSTWTVFEKQPRHNANSANNQKDTNGPGLNPPENIEKTGSGLELK
nr:hypothetical protein BgiMline_031124 [Biomphalaria glabrata]